jgi:hypothetical protein
MSDARSAEAAFASLATELLGDPDVDEGTGFGTNPGLRVGRRIFAMLVRGELVVKLPRERCAALVDEGAAEPFEVGNRRMKEWVAVGPEHGDAWPGLAGQALEFVRPAR